MNKSRISAQNVLLIVTMMATILSWGRRKAIGGFYRKFFMFALTILLLNLAVVAWPGATPSQSAASPATRKFLLIAKKADLVIDEGVVFKAFTFNGTVPGPLLLVEEGDSVEITVQNVDSITHGLSVHAANTQTSLFVGNIGAGQTKTLTFKADFPGVYLYHCAPGGHGIMTHTMAGMGGMIVVEPKDNYRLEEELGKFPDLKVYIVQHEVYASGRDFFDGSPLYVMFNGYNFRYVSNPIPVRPGDYVRFYYLNTGPNLVSTFHIVGGIWEYIYYGGNPNNTMIGTQSAVSGPTDSWVIEWRVPAEGPFTLVSHAFGTQAIKGAIGILSSELNALRIGEIRSEGPTLPLPTSPMRVVDAFGIGTTGRDWPVRFQPGEAVLIQMVGNSFWPKVVEVPVGANVTWVNEDVFDLLAGERTGRHDAVAIKRPQTFISPLLGHADEFTFTFTKAGEYEYTCSVHPYMKGIIKVYEPDLEKFVKQTGASVSELTTSTNKLAANMTYLTNLAYVSIALAILGIALATLSLIKRTRKL